jgi:signal transduction histidine kinase
VRPIRFHRTAVFRLALAYVVLFSSSSLILLGFIYWATSAYVARQTDDIITTDLASIADRFREGGTNAVTRTIDERVSQDWQADRIYLLADSSYRRLAGNLERWPDTAPGADGWLDFGLVRPGGDPAEPDRIRARRVDLPNGQHLLVGRDTYGRTEFNEMIGRVVAWSSALTVGLGLIGGMVISFGTVRRIESINRATRDIMSGDLSRRIPSRDTNDEFDRLAGHLNAMLDRIEALMATVRGISDDIAHDLRTPLARLRISLEMARAKPRTGAGYDAWIDDMIAGVDDILATFGALLKIAEIEAHGPRDGFAAVDLTRIVTDLAEVYAAVAAERDQHFDVLVKPTETVTGDRDLLFGALANLLDNAIKYTPEGGQIWVKLSPGDQGPEVVVADSGPGIPTEAREKVFRRLFRLEASRTTPGSGLGLSLVAAVARVHGVTIRLDDNHPGLRVILTFPRRPAPPAPASMAPRRSPRCRNRANMNQN